MRILRSGLLAALAVLLLVPAGARAADDDPKLAKALNDAVVASNKKLHDAGFALGKSIGALLGGGTDKDAVKKNYDAAVDVYTKVNADMAKYRDMLPKGQSAKDFYEAHQNFLKGQDKLLKTEIADIVKVVEDKTLEGDAKKAKVDELIKKIAESERSQLEPLQKAQAVFCKDFNLQLKP